MSEPVHKVLDDGASVACGAQSRPISDYGLSVASFWSSVTCPACQRARFPEPVIIDGEAQDAPPDEACHVCGAPADHDVHGLRVCPACALADFVNDFLDDLPIRARRGDAIYQLRRLPAQDLIGLSSELTDGRHMAFWDFDDADLADVVADLRDAQDAHALPSISISESSPGSYLAWSPCARDLREVAQIALRSPLTDARWVGVSLSRGYFTIRISAKDGGEPPRSVAELQSDRPAEADAATIQSVHYEARGE